VRHTDVDSSGHTLMDDHAERFNSRLRRKTATDIARTSLRCTAW
jgi:hypothetical protein